MPSLRARTQSGASGMGRGLVPVRPRGPDGGRGRTGDPHGPRLRHRGCPPLWLCGLFALSSATGCLDVRCVARPSAREIQSLHERGMCWSADGGLRCVTPRGAEVGGISYDAPASSPPRCLSSNALRATSAFRSVITRLSTPCGPAQPAARRAPSGSSVPTREAGSTSIPAISPRTRPVASW